MEVIDGRDENIKKRYVLLGIKKFSNLLLGNESVNDKIRLMYDFEFIATIMKTLLFSFIVMIVFGNPDHQALMGLSVGVGVVVSVSFFFLFLANKIRQEIFIEPYYGRAIEEEVMEAIDYSRNIAAYTMYAIENRG